MGAKLVEKCRQRFRRVSEKLQGQLERHATFAI